MKLKRLLMLFLSVLLTVFLMACGGNGTEEPSDVENENLEEPDSIEMEEDNLGKRSSPVPVGKWIEFTDTYYESLDSWDEIEGHFKLRITEVIRGDEALYQLMEENQFNEPAPDGNEWIIVNFEIEMLEGDEDVAYTVSPYISVLSSSGNEIPQDNYGTLDGNEFGYVDLFPGGIHSGRQAKYVPVGDDSLLVYETGFDKSIYFSISGDGVNEEVGVEETTELADSQGEKNTEEKADSDKAGNLGKRSNPVPVGEWIEFTDTYYESLENWDEIEGRFKLRITEVTRGDEAYEQLKKENQFNDPAPEGNEWIIVNFEIEMLEGDEDAPYSVSPYITVFSSSGNEISQDDYGTLDGNEYGYVDLFPGGTHSGRETKYIPVGDESLLAYETGFDQGIYFSINQ